MADRDHRLRVLFAGRDNDFNRGLIRWLGTEHEVVGVFFLEPGRATLRGRWQMIRRRVKRYGLLQVLDELAFHVFDRAYLRRGERRLWERDVPVDFRKAGPVEPPSFQVENAHAESWLAMARELTPDIVFSVCCAVIFKRSFYEIPRLGTFVLHEAMTPEIRGLHSPLWALVNREPEHIGFSLLRIDDSIDGGEILAQKRYQLAAGEGARTWSLVAHKAVLAGLPEIQNGLMRLARDGDFEPISQEGRPSRYYTWMGLSTFLRQEIRTRRQDCSR